MSKGIHDLPLSYDLTYGHEMQIRVHASEGVDVSSYIPIGKGLMIDLVNEARFNSISQLERKVELFDGSVIVCQLSYGVQRIDIYPSTVEEGEGEEATPAFICTPRSASLAPYGWLLREGVWIAAETETEEAIFYGWRVFNDDGDVIRYEISPSRGAIEDGKFKSRWKAGNSTWTSSDGKVLISWMMGIYGRSGGTAGLQYNANSDPTGEIYMNGEIVVEPIFTGAAKEKPAPVIGACVVDGHVIFGVREADYYYLEEYYSIYKQEIGAAQNPVLLGEYRPGATYDVDTYLPNSYFYGLVFTPDGTEAQLHYIRPNFLRDDLSRSEDRWDFFKIHDWTIGLDEAELTISETPWPPYVRTVSNRYQESNHDFSASMYSSASASAVGSSMIVDMGINPAGERVTRSAPSPFTSGSSSSSLTASKSSTDKGDCGEYGHLAEISWDWTSGDSFFADTQCCPDDSVGVKTNVATPRSYSYSASGAVSDEEKIIDSIDDDLKYSIKTTGSSSLSSSYSVEEKWVYDCGDYGDVYTRTGSSTSNASSSLTLTLSTQIGDIVIAAGGDSVSESESLNYTLENSEGVGLPNPSGAYYDMWRANRGLEWNSGYYEWPTDHGLGVFNLQNEAVVDPYDQMANDVIEMSEYPGSVSSGFFSTSRAYAPGIKGSYIRMDGQILFSLTCGAMYNKDTESESNLVTPVQGINYVLGANDLSLVNAPGSPVLDAADTTIGFVFQVTPDGT